MVNRNDVAREAGVSTATVSYYMNNSGYVSEKTRKKIEMAIEKLQYIPNPLAKSLTTKDSKQILYICDDISNPFHTEVASGISSGAYAQGYHTMLCSAEDDQEYMLQACRYMVSGVMIACPRVENSTIEAIVKMGIPVVLLENRNFETMPEKVISINIDYKTGIRKFLQKMEQDGHKTIGCVMASQIQKKGEQSSNERKINALFYLLEESTLQLKDDFLIELTDKEENIVSAHKKCLEVMEDKERIPDVIFCSNDTVAVGVVRAVWDRGLRVPEDVAIVGIDNTMLANATYPPLSSIDTHPEEIGKLAVKLLLSVKAGEEVPPENPIFSNFVPRVSC